MQDRCACAGGSVRAEFKSVRSFKATRVASLFFPPSPLPLPVPPLSLSPSLPRHTPAETLYIPSQHVLPRVRLSVLLRRFLLLFSCYIPRFFPHRIPFVLALSLPFQHISTLPHLHLLLPFQCIPLSAVCTLSLCSYLTSLHPYLPHLLPLSSPFLSSLPTLRCLS